MKIGDLVKYAPTGQLFVVVWSDGAHVKLGGFPQHQVFNIKGCALEHALVVVNEDR